MWDDVFYNNIIKKDHIKFSKEWHKNIKKMTNYTINKGILNLKNGPITKTQEFE